MWLFNKKNKKTKDNDDQKLINQCKLIEEEDRVLVIEKLENYIYSENKLGKIFTYLMELYNKELSEARKSGNDEQINLYLNKIDDLMKKSKDIVRGR